MGLLDKWDIGVVYWDDIGDVLAKIRDDVTPVPTARFR